MPNVQISGGYRRIVPYIESVQGGDTTMQAKRIRQLYEDFESDFICLDTRNAGRNAPHKGNFMSAMRKKAGTLKCKSDWKAI